MSEARIQFEGASYDLTDFEHPGGSVIRAGYLTDATALIHAYHPDADRVRKAIAPFQVANQKQVLDQAVTSRPTKGIYKGPLYAELKRRVHAAIREKSQSTGADFAMRCKMVFLLLLYIASFVCLSLSNDQTHILVAGTLLGMLGAMIGMNVMHDASHMAIERGPDVWKNYLWQMSGDMIGMSALGWRYQHAVQHHVHTDNKDDCDAAWTYPLLRTDENQPHLFLHYFQMLVGVPLVLFTLIVSFQIYDAVHVITGYYTYEGLRKPIGTRHTKAEWAQFGLAKFCMLAQWAMLFHKGGLPAFVLYCMGGSFLLSSIDVPGHYTTHPALPPTSKLPPSIREGDVIDNWLLEQLHHTNTFAPQCNALYGGLNMQIEHHLFPRISHRHYPMMRPILQEFCKEYNFPYNDYSLVGVLVATLERMVGLSLPPKKKVL